MEEAYEFLKETAPTYYLATVEDGNPRVRPFGTIDLYEGRLYIQTGKSKKVYRMYDENDDNTIVLYFKNATATFESLADGSKRTIGW